MNNLKLIRFNDNLDTQKPDDPDKPNRMTTSSAMPCFMQEGGYYRAAFFRCIINSEIAAGVTPGIREAWPMVSGRFSDNF